jgi:type VI secretion system protein ImpF
MADQQLYERLQPSLLDRLTDDDPTNMQETRAHRVIDLEKLRQIVRRDLAWLLNTTNFAASQDLERYPNVAKSVLNYGIPDTAGQRITDLRDRSIEQLLRKTILTFEPRIMTNSLKVTYSETTDRDQTAVIAFDVRGQLWAQPVPLELFIRSEVDVTSGEVKIVDG